MNADYFKVCKSTDILFLFFLKEGLFYKQWSKERSLFKSDLSSRIKQAFIFLVVMGNHHYPFLNILYQRYLLRSGHMQITDTCRPDNNNILNCSKIVFFVSVTS